MTKILPACLTAGLTFDRVIEQPRYPANEGWALSIALRGAGSINISAEVEDDKHRVRANATSTGAWVPGRYKYSVRVTKGAEIFEVESGSLEILPDLNAQSAGFDGRSEAKKALDAIDAVLAKRATMDQERYRIGDRELYRTPIEQLLVLRDRYQSMVNAEERRAAGGKLFGRAVRVIL